MRWSWLPALICLGVAAGPTAAEIPDAVLVLESLTAALPGQVPEAAPPLFVLMEDGRVFVGGTRGMAAGRLEKTDTKELDSKVSRVRRITGLGASVTIGPGVRRQRLLLHKSAPIVIQGDPSGAPASLKPLAVLLEDLERFDHPSLKPYAPTSFIVRAREGTLPGGCRTWSFPFPLAQALASGQVVPAAGRWPTGANPASVCEGKARYVVTVRPLLPGERP